MNISNQLEQALTDRHSRWNTTTPPYAYIAGYLLSTIDRLVEQCPELEAMLLKEIDTINRYDQSNNQ